MTQKRSYAQIQWYGYSQKSKLGLMMVNKHPQSFFIYAKQIVSMSDHVGKLIQVKRRDRNPENAKHPYPGDIIGKLEEKGSVSFITLFFGTAEKRLRQEKSSGEILDAIDKQRYMFPTDEINILIGSLKQMVDQRSTFDEMIQDASTVPDVIIVDDDED